MCHLARGLNALFQTVPSGARLAEFRDLLPLVLPTDANLSRAKELRLARGASLWDALILAAWVTGLVRTPGWGSENPGARDSEIPKLGNFGTLDRPQHEQPY